MPLRRKLKIYYACIATRIIYGLETLNLTNKDITRLQVFEHRTIRRILRIPASMISHISNEAIMSRAKVEKCLPKILLASQLRLVGHIIRAPVRDPLRVVCLEPTQEYRPRTLARGIQRVGYAHSAWWIRRATSQVPNFNARAAFDRAEWRGAVQRRCAGRHSMWAFVDCLTRRAL